MALAALWTSQIQKLVIGFPPSYIPCAQSTGCHLLNLTQVRPTTYHGNLVPDIPFGTQVFSQDVTRRWPFPTMIELSCVVATNLRTSPASSDLLTGTLCG